MPGLLLRQPAQAPPVSASLDRGTPIGTDHAWQLDRLRAAAQHGFQVRTTDCLGPCDQANVIVVQLLDQAVHHIEHLRLGVRDLG